MDYRERALLQHKWLIDRYGEEIGLWIGAHFDRWYDADDNREFEYMDNLRCCELNNPQEIAEYKEKEARGCCGSYEEILYYPNGRTFKVGFNYGH